MKQRSYSIILRFHICLNVFFKLLGKKRLFDSNSWLSITVPKTPSQNSNFNKEQCLNSLSLIRLLVEKKINLNTGILLLKTEAGVVHFIWGAKCNMDKNQKQKAAQLRNQDPSVPPPTTNQLTANKGGQGKTSVNKSREQGRKSFDFSENKRKKCLPHPELIHI